jgi:pyridoxine/pyridoxamine 5'-phosphate oxidase
VQSHVIDSRELLESRMQEVAERYADGNPPLPPHRLPRRRPTPPGRSPSIRP